MKKLLLLSTSLTACSFLVLSSSAAFANPEGGVVSAGSATIETSSARVDVHQSSDKAVIDWRSFNIDKGETTQFHQPGSSSLTVNRINDANPSQILGSLKANGNVVLINQSGISFGKDAVVDVGGLIATTSDISNADAMAGHMNFAAPGRADAVISNAGTITAKEAGLVGLVAPHVENRGVINAKLGKVHLATGDKFTLDLYGDGAISIQASDDLQNQIVSNSGKVNAEGGVIQVTAATGANLVSSLVQIDGELSAPSATIGAGGKIIISGSDATNVSLSGKLDASGSTGGTVSVRGHNVLQQGKILANGSAGQGGSVDIQAGNAYLDSEAAQVQAKGSSGKGGAISVKSGSRAFVSGQYDVSSDTHRGGSVKMTAAGGDLKLFGAKVIADGASGGGSIQIGGEFQGGGTLEHAATTSVNYATVLSADATEAGKGGEVIVWSDDETLFGGTARARGGVSGGNGGQIEISSKNTMKIAGDATTTAAARMDAFMAGNLLLDPKNIVIATGGLSGGISYFEFVDPNPDSNGFGTGSLGEATLLLSNGNVVILDPQDDLMASNSGAAYLFNGATGALISTLTGSNVNDQVGYSGVTALTNGNYVIKNPFWRNGAFTGAGAVTWGSSTTGVSGVVSAANSLVGNHTDDNIGFFGVVALDSGNYLVRNPFWNSDRGAVTFGNGLGGTVGVVSAANSLVGSTANDRVGSNIVLLSNGNYLVGSSLWDNGGISNVGAVTWGSGASGVLGTISAANSLIGSMANDYVGADTSGNTQIVALDNGNYFVGSMYWNNGAVADAGALTWGDGSVGTVGVVSSANSLVGSTANDRIGGIGSGEDALIVALPSGNYVVGSYSWDNGGAADAGAVTWLGDGTVGLTGVISAANSLIGSTAGDRVGGIRPYVLANGNYVVASPDWDNGGAADVGAVTWGNGTTGITGVVSSANSLVGSTDSDMVGSSGITVLGNGNYVVGSEFWDNGAVVDAGASTWANGTTGITGVVSTANSLFGTSDFDNVGQFVFEVSGNNYVVVSYSWDNGAIVDSGAATWVDGSTGLVGSVSGSNSFVSNGANSYLGAWGIASVGTNKFLIVSPNWNDGTGTDYGAVTWVDPTVSTSGIVSAANSLVGSVDGDQVGANGAYALTNGNYLVGSPYWDNGAIVDAGAATWANGNTGVFGTISSTNSLVGSSAGDYISAALDNYNGVEMPSGNVILLNYNWDNGAAVDAGAVTWMDGDTGAFGVISASNSLVGSNTGDYLGWQDWGHPVLSTGDYALICGGCGGGSGAFTIIDGDNGSFGELTAYNSLFGTGSFWGGDLEDTVNGRFLVIDGAGKVYSVDYINQKHIGDYNSFSDLPSADITLDPAFVTNVLNAGTSVTLQANNDITLNDDLIANNASGDGGTLTFQAGRSILFNADIFTDNGDLNLFANEDLSAGVVNAQRDAGSAVISMGAGTSIDAGSGTVIIRLDDGTGKTNRGAGNVTLRDITAGTIFARNMNTGRDVVLESGTLTATNAGDAITLVSRRNFINNSGAAALSTPSGRWLIYSIAPAGNMLGGLVEDFSLYSCTYGGVCPALQANNGLLYSSSLTTPPSPGDSTTNTVDDIPDTVDYVSLGGFLEDLQDDAVLQSDSGFFSESAPGQSLAGDDPMIVEFSYASDEDAINAEELADGSYVTIHRRLKYFLSNPFAMLEE